MLTEFVRGINQSFLGFLFGGNRKANLPITISIQPNRGEAIWNLETGRLVSNELIPKINTTTETIGKETLSFFVPSIRLGNSNLAGEGRILDVEIELPNENKVKLEVIGEHYERVGKRTSIANYLIEAKIVYINPLDEDEFKNYLRRGEKMPAAQHEGFVFGITER